jgi:hypothetical protein
MMWRRSVEEPLWTHEPATVTYGSVSASYLATHCQQQLAKDELNEFSLAPEAFMSNVYVDGALCEANTV